MSTTQSTIDGQRAAERFLLDLATVVPAGDDLFQLVSQHTAALSVEQNAFMRGFCRRLQKELEARA